MKLNLQREALLKPLQQVIGVVERKQTRAILSNVLINAKDNKITVTGTDLEVQLIGQTNIEGTIKAGCLTLPGRKLVDICKALPENAAIELYQEKERAILTSGRSRFVLTTLPASDFPNIETKEATVSFSLPQKKLHYILQRTVFAMAQQDVRYYLNGMLVEISNNILRAVATDGHRLALNEITISANEPEKRQFIVPRKGTIELMRLLEENDFNVKLIVSNHHIRVEGENYIFTSKLIDGRFPNYERVIPKSGDKIIKIDRNTLKFALNRAAILCNEKFRGVRFELRKNLLKILANNPEQEAAEDELNVEYTGENLDIGFNVTYLLDILNVLKPGPITLTFIDANSSILVEEQGNNKTDNDGDNSLFVVMPMKL